LGLSDPLGSIRSLATSRSECDDAPEFCGRCTRLSSQFRTSTTRRLVCLMRRKSRFLRNRENKQIDRTVVYYFLRRGRPRVLLKIFLYAAEKCDQASVPRKCSAASLIRTFLRLSPSRCRFDKNNSQRSCSSACGVFGSSFHDK
jgi:hypothetical protein